MRWYVDRLVEGKAVLVDADGEHEVVVPLSWLPEGAGEGSVLTVALDPAEEAKIREKIEAHHARMLPIRKLDL